MRDVRKTEIVSNIARLPGDEFVSITFSFAIRCYTAHLLWHHTTQRIISWSFFRETSQHATTKICNSKCEIELIQHPNRQYMAIYMEKIKTINSYAGPIQYKNFWLLYGSKIEIKNSSMRSNMIYWYISLMQTKSEFILYTRWMYLMLN